MIYEPNYAADRAAAAAWARAIIADGSALVLDTETTGLHGDVGIVQIAICDLEGREILNSLVQSDVPITPGASRIHGITAEDIADAPRWADVWERVHRLLAERGYPPLVIYNAAYDRGIIRQCCARAGLPIPPLQKVHCAMEWYSQFIGEWSEWYSSYRWQRLPDGDHSAMGDALATLAVIRGMARDE